jgi:hypothetical protein
VGNWRIPQLSTSTSLFTIVGVLGVVVVASLLVESRQGRQGRAVTNVVEGVVEGIVERSGPESRSRPLA